jgi:phosphatidylglycerol---prolipoprotein diacylglyceryl transferase
MTAGAFLHGLFEVLAWLAAIAAGWQIKCRYLIDDLLPLHLRKYPLYMIVVWLGAVAGAMVLGTLNLHLAGMAGTGRSILGAMIGGVITAEAYKLLFDIRGSTGIVFVVPLATAIAIGRIGCFLAGLADFTYGTPTDLPWGVDFGDGIRRHPVQLYESFSMLAFLCVFIWQIRRQREWIMCHGFYLFTLAYAGQRFLWEFVKPYSAVIGPLNLFHLTCLLLIFYALTMLRLAEPAHARV